MMWANEIQCFNECFSAIIMVMMMKIMMMTMIVAVWCALSLPFIGFYEILV